MAYRKAASGSFFYLHVVRTTSHFLIRSKKYKLQHQQLRQEHRPGLIHKTLRLRKLSDANGNPMNSRFFKHVGKIPAFYRTGIAARQTMQNDQ